MSHSQFMEELSAELCGVPKGSGVPPRVQQCYLSHCPAWMKRKRRKEVPHLRDSGQQTRQQRAGSAACFARSALFGSVHGVMWPCVLAIFLAQKLLQSVA